MPRNAIPAHVQRWADAVIQEFNEQVIRDPNRFYCARYRGKYLYLDHLTYTGNTDQWEFAIFKYSDERYDADEWFFPGAGHIDGTLAGALRAGLEAYP